jgi:hypothetical protein
MLKLCCLLLHTVFTTATPAAPDGPAVRMLTETGKPDGAPPAAVDVPEGEVEEAVVPLAAAAPAVWLLALVALSAKASGGVEGTTTGLNRSLQAASAENWTQKA